MLQRITFSTCFAAVALMAASISLAQKPLAIQNATIITGTGERIEDGTILMRDGKIKKVGKDIKVPVAAQIIDGSGYVVIPGLVEAHTSEGLSQANETNQVVPYVTVMDGIDPMNAYFRQARRNGVTTVRISPGNSFSVSHSQQPLLEKLCAGDTVTVSDEAGAVDLLAALAELGCLRDG